jgi:hypothetical protein
MTRDQRFVAAHRGGPLDLTRHRLLASWAADCAEHVLPLFAEKYPDDDRPWVAITAARAWARGEASVSAARQAAFRAHAAAREASAGAARAAARAAGQAVSTPHMADHSLGAAVYALRAVKLASAEQRAEHGAGQDADEAVAREHRWQREHLPKAVRELVVSAQDEGTVLGDWQP